MGAHVGTRALAMRAARARVVALEPQAAFSTFVRMSLPRDIGLIAAAASGSQSTAHMAVSPRHPTVSSFRPGFVTTVGGTPGFEMAKWDAVQNVWVATLDTLISEEGAPRYIKVVVEGVALDVFAGLSCPVATISVEYLPSLSKPSKAGLPASPRMTNQASFKPSCRVPPDRATL